MIFNWFIWFIDGIRTISNILIPSGPWSNGNEAELLYSSDFQNWKLIIICHLASYQWPLFFVGFYFYARNIQSMLSPVNKVEN